MFCPFKSLLADSPRPRVALEQPAGLAPPTAIPATFAAESGVAGMAALLPPAVPANLASEHERLTRTVRP